jgi:hypothetical protein
LSASTTGYAFGGITLGTDGTVRDIDDDNITSNIILVALPPYTIV